MHVKHFQSLNLYKYKCLSENLQVDLGWEEDQGEAVLLLDKTLFAFQQLKTSKFMKMIISSQIGLLY